jgi:hypothetical protein
MPEGKTACCGNPLILPDGVQESIDADALIDEVRLKLLRAVKSVRSPIDDAEEIAWLAQAYSAISGA